MGVWGTAIFSDDLAADIRGEYNALLSIGKENDEAERLLFDHYCEIIQGDDEEEPVFWMALALAEWNKGRLSPFVKQKALNILDNGGDLERWNEPGNEKNYQKRQTVIRDLRNKLLSEMPPKKRMKASVRHCPWKVGSLLAYRIIAHDEKLKEDQYFGKYVLLRVVKLVKHPISTIVPEEVYNETMLVGLYNWVGSEIPEPQIVEQLEYIPILDNSKVIAGLFAGRIDTCAQLNWMPIHGKKGEIVFLGRDESFEEKTPDFFKTEITQYGMYGFLSFDLWLVKRLKEYFGENYFTK